MRVPPSVRKGLVVCATLSAFLGYVTGTRMSMGYPDTRWPMIVSITVVDALWIFGIYGLCLALAWAIRWLWRKMHTPRGGPRAT
jgi:hypothetical protein